MPEKCVNGKCGAGKVCNPATGFCLKIGGAAYNKMMMESRKSVPSPAPKAKKPLPPTPKHKPDCFESETSALACFSKLIEQYPMLKEKCACPAQVTELQEAAGATVLLKAKDKIVGVVDEEGVMRKVSPPMQAPPSPPPLPVFNASKKLQESLNKTKPLDTKEREQLKDVNSIGDLLADIRKGKKLRTATPMERKAIKRSGLEDAIARAMDERRRAIHGED